MQTYTVVVVLPCRPVLDTPTHMQHSTTPPAHRTQARRAGNGAIADMLAEAAHDRQLKPLRDALAPGGSAAGRFDSTTARILALFDAAGLELPRTRGYGNDADLIMVPDGAPLCSVCMQEDVGAALVPCMHAQFCPTCATAIVSGQHSTVHRTCPVCRTHVTDIIRIYI
eukprot:m.324076 g.324076  ORF g.324076 m.324076 type:complete len:169 (+) comp20368_c0_seq5:16-522(+)